MVLAIDIGNSNVGIGLFGPDAALRFVSSFHTAKLRAVDQCAVDILNIFSLYGEDIKKVDGAIISSVVPPFTASIAAAVRKLTDVSPFIMGPGLKTGLNIKTEIHTQLGTDIVASAVGVINKYPLPAIIVDMGTATTISAIDENSSFLGCSIMPGVGISLDALAERTAQLPDISLEAPAHAIGRNTIESMRSGIIYGTVGMIDSMISEFERETGKSYTIVATGEYTKGIIERCTHSVSFDADILMEGLYLIYEKNRSHGQRR